MHHRRRARRRPQPRPVVGIIRNLPARAADQVDRREHRVGGTGRDALADAGGKQHPRRRQRVARQVGGRVQRGGRILAVVQELMPSFVMRDEIHPGQRAIAADHAGGIDPFARPQRQQRLAGRVVADRGDVADPRPLARRRDGGVRGVAAVALQKQHAPVRLRRQLVELQHRLAHAQQIDRHHAPAPREPTSWEPAPGESAPGAPAMTCCAAATIAARSPAAMRRSSTSAPPMPTNAAPAAR